MQDSSFPLSGPGIVIALLVIGIVVFLAVLIPILVASRKARRARPEAGGDVPASPPRDDSRS